LNEVNVSEQARKYWQYEYDVADKYMVPLLERWGVSLKNASVIDVGCGEGGGLCSLYDRGAHCVGFDVESPRIEVAQQLKGERAIVFFIGNLYNPQLPFAEANYDLVVLHDVFEHLDQKPEMLAKLKRLMGPAGKLLITFPPYYSAYGAHQQLLQSRFAKLPFFHLIPFSISHVLPQLKKEDKYFVDEVQKLARLKMGLRKFETIVQRVGLTIAGKQAYIVSPNHIRFGLRPIPASTISEIPVIGELVCTGVVYLLS
jgi:SAM-dependent methyltransferase